MIIFDSDGDVVTRMREMSELFSVNALYLSSNVFSTILRSSFKEGVQLSEGRSDPKVVSLCLAMTQRLFYSAAKSSTFERFRGSRVLKFWQHWHFCVTVRL
jgi:hypothetical protein